MKIERQFAAAMVVYNKELADAEGNPELKKWLESDTVQALVIFNLAEAVKDTLPESEIEGQAGLKWTWAMRKVVQEKKQGDYERLRQAMIAAIAAIDKVKSGGSRKGRSKKRRSKKRICISVNT